MAPTTARHTDGRTLAVGSPGADRITTAVHAYGFPTVMHEDRSMFFGGVGATLLRRDGTLAAAGDPRREAATLVS